MRRSKLAARVAVTAAVVLGGTVAGAPAAHANTWVPAWCEIKVYNNIGQVYCYRQAEGTFFRAKTTCDGYLWTTYTEYGWWERKGGMLDSHGICRAGDDALRVVVEQA